MDDLLRNVMQISKIQTHEIREAKELIKMCFGENFAVGSLNYSDAFIGKKENRLIAVSGFIKSELHPQSYKTVVAVLPEFRRKYYATKIHQVLIESGEKSPDIKIDACCYSNQVDVQTFIKKLGYEHYLDCHTLELDVDKPFIVEDSFEVKSYSELQSSGFDLNTLKTFLINRYIEAHSWNPPRDKNDPIWNYLRQERSNEELSFAIIKDGLICAASEGHSGVDIRGTNFAIGWYYANQNCGISEIRLLKTLLSNQLSKFKATGASTCYIEMDSSEHTTQELLKWLPIKKMEILERYRMP